MMSLIFFPYLTSHVFQVFAFAFPTDATKGCTTIRTIDLTLEGTQDIY